MNLGWGVVRVINDFKANMVNMHAWLPSKMRYDSYDSLQAAAAELKRQWPDELCMGKADFKSAFKTLPVDEEQGWMCYALIYSPDAERHMVAPIRSQAFGSLGAVAAWFRIAKAIQCIMLRVFKVVIFAYVDDCFWVTPAIDDDSQLNARNIACAFEYVVTHLLGWRLDPDKTSFGKCITVLGCMGSQESSWQLSADKAEAWTAELKEQLSRNRLTPAEASKLGGRLSFLNSTCFNRLGRAILRPIIWRQTHVQGTFELTRRLRWSMLWFLKALEARWARQVPYSIDLEQLAVVYSDAESHGSIAAVFILDDKVQYLQAMIPRSVMSLLQPRLTNIVAYELIAAIVAVLHADRILPKHTGLRHFVDSKPALGCILKGSSPQFDLNCLAGYVWYVAGSRMRSYWGQYVRSKCNLADAPSRGDVGVMKQLRAEQIHCDVAQLSEAAAWLKSLKSELLVT